MVQKGKDMSPDAVARRNRKKFNRRKKRMTDSLKSRPKYGSMFKDL